MAWLLGVLKLTILAILIIMPYRAVVGGVHFKTHIKCILATGIFYIGTAILSKYIEFGENTKNITTGITWILAIGLITLYAPADTEDVPILRQKERRIKKILSYIILTTMLSCSMIIKNNVLSNLLLFGAMFQTITIARFMYKLAGNKYGYEEYIKNQNRTL